MDANYKIDKTHFIIMVQDLEKSKMFYEILLDRKPIVDECNICEFELNANTILGLMTKDLTENIFDADFTHLIPTDLKPSYEIYIECTDAEAMHQKALRLGCLEVSPFRKRSWGHTVGYSVNHEGHILAFALPD